MSKRRTRDSRDHLSKTIFVGLLIAVVFAALAHGAVEPWSVFVFEILIVGLLILWAIKVVAGGRFRLEVPPAAFPIGALVFVGLLQSVALTDAGGRWMSLSKNVGYTRSAVTVLIFLLLSFLIASNFIKTRERLLVLGQFLVIYGLAMALFGLVQHFTWNGRFYWLRQTEATSAFGPFANHNHFAGYMELLIPIPIALIITRAVSAELRVLYAFAATMMGLAAVLSLSRGGIISIAASMMFLVMMSLRVTRRAKESSKRGHWKFASQAAVVIAIALVISAGIFWIGADPVLKRVTEGQASSAATEKETFFSSRGWVWRDTAAMIRANPLLGVGLGAYETAFSIYTKSDGSLRVPQAHNDYLQIVADAGIAGGLIALWFLFSIFRSIGRGTRSGDPLFAGLALGCGSGIFAILVHSVFDFNLQLPSNALLFLLLSAVVTTVGAAIGDQRGSAQKLSSRNSVKLERESVSSTSLVGGIS
ncbi:MAG: O-antigen ligase family protein [Blastocatellia bacterium]